MELIDGKTIADVCATRTYSPTSPPHSHEHTRITLHVRLDMKSETDNGLTSQPGPPPVCMVNTAGYKPSAGMIRLFATNMLAALRELSTHAMLHRDLKPENIMLLESGAIKVGSAHIFTPICIQR